MRNLIVLFVLCASGVAMAAPQGTSTIKLNDSENDVRVTRKAIEGLDKEIASLDQKISEARSQILSVRSVPAANPSAGAALEGLVTALEIERNQLTSRRESLRTDLEYQSN